MLDWRVVALSSVVAAGVAAAIGCGTSHGPFTRTPKIANLNGATAAASPAGVSLEINGSNFGSVPGSVRFAQGSTTPIDVVPVTSVWSDTTLLVKIPATLQAGSVSVSVITTFTNPPSNTAPVTSTQQSNVVSLTITPTSGFSPSNVLWAGTQSLPLGRQGHAAVATPGSSSTTAFLFAIGGNEGVGNVTSVLVGSIDNNGGVSAWQPTNAPLPQPRSFLAGAEADASNSPVTGSNVYLYAIGGQQTALDTPGGTSTVWVSKVDTGAGNLGAWTATSSLPESRVGCAAVVVNGFLVVTGGLDATGRPVGGVAVAAINADGTLGGFSEANGTNLPTPVAFHNSFAFGGFLYVIDGDIGSSTNPFDTSSASATNVTWVAPIRRGTLGSWSTTGSGIKPRSKASLVFASGQLLLFDGLYGNTNFEGERSAVNADGTLQSFNGMNGGATPGLGVYNGAGVTSPVLTATGNPRFILVGGAKVANPATFSAAVSRTSAP